MQPPQQPSNTQSQFDNDSGLSQIAWDQSFDEEGRILDEYALRKTSFIMGINPDVRREAWKYLLGLYPCSSTLSDRIEYIWAQSKRYDALLDQAIALEQAKDVAFMKHVKIIDKDVARTDRDHSFYAGDNNPNLKSLRNILLVSVIADPELGYIQGMNDLLAPLVYTMQNELAAFCCFGALTKRMRTNFIKIDMHEGLSLLKNLIKFVDPKMHDHLCACQMDADMDWLFCHRWLLLDFKREFNLDSIAIVWERIWAEHSTNYFNIFIAASILLVNQESIWKIANPDELLGYLQNLTAGIDAPVVINTAHSLVKRLSSSLSLPKDLKVLVAPINGTTFAPPPRAGFTQSSATSISNANTNVNANVNANTGTYHGMKAPGKSRNPRSRYVTASSIASPSNQY
eukprot:m.103416 g.103416  ORF g.103416 m.103416 type:complete len:400 (+) comp27496_c0_seq4:156-1355(+)